MSEVINGNAGDITTPLVRTISALSSGVGGVVRVQTSVAHLYGPGDYVLITGTGIGALDGNYFIGIVIIDPTHFDIPGTTFTTTATGTSEDFSLTPQIQWPTDGDPTNTQLSGLLSGGIWLASRTQFLAEVVTLHKVEINQLQGDVLGTYRLIGAPAKFGAVSTPGSPTNYFFANAWASNTTFVAGSTQILATLATGVLAGDLIEVEFESSMTTTITTAAFVNSFLRLEYTENGGSPAAFETASAMRQVSLPNTGQDCAPVALSSVHTVVTGGAFTVNINGAFTAGGAPGASTLYCSFGWSLKIKHWRLNA